MCLLASVWSGERYVQCTLYTKPVLIQEAEVYGDTNVGELLKRKASEGVRVLVMIWNDKTNDSGHFSGIMGTHDEDTYKYFKVKLRT